MILKWEQNLLEANLKQPKPSYTHSTIVNIYIVYELDASSYRDDHTLKNYLFDAVRLTKNVDVDKYGYSGYGIGFDRKAFYFQMVDLVRI